MVNMCLEVWGLVRKDFASIGSAGHDQMLTDINRCMTDVKTIQGYYPGHLWWIICVWNSEVQRKRESSLFPVYPVDRC